MVGIQSHIRRSDEGSKRCVWSFSTLTFLLSSSSFCRCGMPLHCICIYMCECVFMRVDYFSNFTHSEGVGWEIFISKEGRKGFVLVLRERGAVWFLFLLLFVLCTLFEPLSFQVWFASWARFSKFRLCHLLVPPLVPVLTLCDFRD